MFRQFGSWPMRFARHLLLAASLLAVLGLAVSVMITALLLVDAPTRPWAGIGLALIAGWIAVIELALYFDSANHDRGSLKTEPSGGIRTKPGVVEAVALQ